MINGQSIKWNFLNICCRFHKHEPTESDIKQNKQQQNLHGTQEAAESGAGMKTVEKQEKQMHRGERQKDKHKAKGVNI